MTTVSKAKTHCCAIICILVAVVIIPRWRTPRAEKEQTANPYTVPLALTLVLVVVFLLDRACTLLCARWKRSDQVIFCCTLRQRRFHALVKVVWGTLASRFTSWIVDACDCVDAERVVWGKCSRSWESLVVICGLKL